MRAKLNDFIVAVVILLGMASWFVMLYVVANE